MRWVVDGSNVVGSRPDGWWNDRPAACRRLAQRIAEWSRDHPDDDVVLVFDGPADARITELAGGPVRIEVASRRGRDAADDRIVEIVQDAGPPTVVVTSDRGLVARLPMGIDVVGAGAFRRDQLGE